MRYFLVDYEAVQNLDGIENLTETDVVILLFMDDTKGVSFRTLAKMNQSKAKIQQKFVNGNQETDMCYAIAFFGWYALCQRKRNYFDCKVKCFFTVSKNIHGRGKYQAFRL